MGCVELAIMCVLHIPLFNIERKDRNNSALRPLDLAGACGDFFVFFLCLIAHYTYIPLS